MGVNTRNEPGRGPGRTAGGGIAMAADELVIPLTHAVVSKTTGNDAEALTLADGVPGQLLTIILTTDGGGAGRSRPRG